MGGARIPKASHRNVISDEKFSFVFCYIAVTALMDQIVILR
jgi:hypothetical protein